MLDKEESCVQTFRLPRLDSCPARLPFIHVCFLTSVCLTRLSSAKIWYTDLSSGIPHSCFSSAVNIDVQYDLLVDDGMRIKALTNKRRLAVFGGDGWG